MIEIVPYEIKWNQNFLNQFHKYCLYNELIILSNFTFKSGGLVAITII